LLTPGANRRNCGLLSVLEKNSQARTFYEHRGWRLATSEGMHDHDGVVEVRYQYAPGKTTSSSE
jgi:hypothetical protein